MMDSPAPNPKRRRISCTTILSIASVLFCAAVLVRVELINLSLSQRADVTDQRLLKVENGDEQPDDEGTVDPLSRGKNQTSREHEQNPATTKGQHEREARATQDQPNLNLTHVQGNVEDKFKSYINALAASAFCRSPDKVCVPGPPGQPGEKGMTGRNGSQGMPGIQGAQGVDGIPGPKGDQGDVGPAGVKGEKGEPGEPGNTGPRGMPGLKGDPGEALGGPEVTVSSNSMTIIENQTALFICTAEGNPKPVVRWEKMNQNSSREAMNEIRNGTLEIRGTQYGDWGRYRCTAESILGKIHKDVMLFVKVPPTFTKTPKQTIIVKERSTISITCETFAYPGATALWFKAYSSLPRGRSTVLNGTLTIKRFRAQDAGTYMCRSTNELGSVSFITTLSICFATSCKDLPKEEQNDGIHEISDNGERFKAYCDMTSDKGGWTLVARFSNNDDKNWMMDSGDYWYDRRSAVGQATDPAANTDMISPAFWSVRGREFKITRTDDSSHTALLYTTGDCLGGQTFRSKVTSYGNFRDGAVWASDSCRGSCEVTYGGRYKSTDGFVQAQCSHYISGNKISFWCDYSGSGAVLMIGGGGYSCGYADHGIGVTQTDSASFIEAGGGEVEYDFGNSGLAGSPPARSYSLNLWVN